VWRVAIASVTSTQNMTSAACLACSGEHARFVGGQSWLSRRSAFLSVMAYVIASNANIGNCGAFRWIVLHFYNLSNNATCVRMLFWSTAAVNDAVCFVIWLHKVGLQLFR